MREPRRNFVSPRELRGTFHQLSGNIEDQRISAFKNRHWRKRFQLMLRLINARLLPQEDRP